MQELAKGWKDDPDTLPILKAHAQTDDDSDVRQAAIQALAQGWKDDLTLFELWCDRVLKDPYERDEYDELLGRKNPRQIALNVLVQQYPDHPKILELLQDRTQNDNDKQLREWAAEQLAKLRN